MPTLIVLLNSFASVMLHSAIHSELLIWRPSRAVASSRLASSTIRACSWRPSFFSSAAVSSPALPKPSSCSTMSKFSVHAAVALFGLRPQQAGLAGSELPAALRRALLSHTCTATSHTNLSPLADTYQQKHNASTVHPSSAYNSSCRLGQI